MQVMAVPTAAEIWSVICGSWYKLEREERETRLIFLNKVLNATLKRVDAGCNMLEVHCM